MTYGETTSCCPPRSAGNKEQHCSIDVCVCGGGDSARAVKTDPYSIKANPATVLSKMAPSDMCNNFLNSVARLLEVANQTRLADRWYWRCLDWHLLPLQHAAYPPYLPKPVRSQSCDHRGLASHYSASFVATSWCSCTICSC